MSWYVKFESTGEIVGPMSKDMALSRAGFCDGLAFNESIFDPTVIISSGVDNLISRLKAWYPFEDVQLTNLLRETINALTILSCDKLVEATINGGVFDVETIPVGVTLSVRDYDISDETDVQDDEIGSYHLMEYGG